MKRFDLTSKEGVIECDTYYKRLRHVHRVIELPELESSRSDEQRKAMFLYCDLVASELNEKGITCHVQDYIDPRKTCEIIWSSELVRSRIWKKMQIALTGKESSNDLTTKEQCIISDAMSNYLAQFEIIIQFPCKDYKD